jgi:hypothetical protein
MGLAYAQNTTQWRRGFYVNATNVSRPCHFQPLALQLVLGPAGCLPS